MSTGPSDAMRLLFVHQNYPGQFRRLAAALSCLPAVEVLGLGDAATLRRRKEHFSYPVLAYPARKPGKSSAHHYLREFEVAIRRGQDVARALQGLKSRGQVPDVVIGHPAWGELLFIRDVFPDCRMIGYFEFFYRAEGSDVGFDPEFLPGPDTRYKLRIRNSVQLHALNDCDAGVSPTDWQRSTYPPRHCAGLQVIHEGFDLDQVAPDTQARFKLVDGRVLTRDTPIITYVSRRLEPYRGFHVFMRALPELQRRLPEVHVVIAGADGVSYGQAAPAPHAGYRDMLLAEVGDQLDRARVHFVGQLPYPGYLSLLRVSRLHLYLTYPFVLSWSMLEAMACGVPVLGSATPPVKEVIREGENGFLFDFFDRQQLVEKACAILAMPEERRLAVGMAARETLVAGYDFRQHSLPAYRQLVGV